MTATTGQPTRSADHRVTLQQIGRWTLVRLAARDIVHDDDNGMVMFRVGTGGTLRKVIVTLMASDTYTVEVGRMNRRTFEWITEKVMTDVYADVLSENVERLFAEVTGA